jgi:hypothetical protein
VGCGKHEKYVWDGAIHFNGDLSRWNVANVANMMFKEASQFNVDISQWNVSDVFYVSWSNSFQ